MNCATWATKEVGNQESGVRSQEEKVLELRLSIREDNKTFSLRLFK